MFIGQECCMSAPVYTQTKWLKNLSKYLYVLPEENSHKKVSTALFIKQIKDSTKPSLKYLKNHTCFPQSIHSFLFSAPVLFIYVHNLFVMSPALCESCGLLLVQILLCMHMPRVDPHFRNDVLLPGCQQKRKTGHSQVGLSNG